MNEAKPIDVERSDVFEKWYKKLNDIQARARILDRIIRLGQGNPGKADTIGEGCSEMIIDYGPGYRVYFKQFGKKIVVLLCGGDKRKQQADIEKAHKIAKLYEKEYGNEN